MRARSRAALILAIVLGATGCRTTIGHYFANRARDLGECFTIQGGIGIGLGVDVRLAGLAHVSAGLGAQVPAMLGPVYGKFHPVAIMNHTAFGGFLSMGVVHLSDPGPRWRGEYFRHGCFALLPGLFSIIGWTDRNRREDPEMRWLWSADPFPEHPQEYPDYARWARVHAFDVEVTVMALLLGARVGFSPGEFLDFLLGWFGIDIAGDDASLERPSEAPTDEAESPGEAGK